MNKQQAHSAMKTFLRSNSSTVSYEGMYHGAHVTIVAANRFGPGYIRWIEGDENWSAEFSARGALLHLMMAPVSRPLQETPEQREERLVTLLFGEGSDF